MYIVLTVYFCDFLLNFLFALIAAHDTPDFGSLDMHKHMLKLIKADTSFEAV
jgi:hypothetical protein